MELSLTEQAENDIKFFLKTGQKNIVKKIEILLSEIERTPFAGTGKPEPLKHNLTGYWSRRINLEHRVIYEVKEEIIFIRSLKGHY